MKRFPQIVLLCTALISAAAAEPRVKSVDGDWDHGGKATIKGKDFGEKKVAKPILFADFDKSIDPSPLGQRTKWDGNENLEWAKEGVDGSGCAKAAHGKGPWTLRVDYEHWSKEGEMAYVFRRQRMNFMITDASQNWKIWRMWPNGESNYPNIYMAASNGECAVEGVGDGAGFYGRFNVPTIDWVGEEFLFRPSNMNSKDGYVAYKCNGAEMGNGAVMTRSTRAPAYMSRNYAVHAVPANIMRWSPPWSFDNRVWVDEVYVDNAWSRVMLGDKPLRKEGRLWEIQIPTRWTDSEVEIVVNTRIFEAGQTVYLFVFDANDRSNEVGYPVKIGPVELASKK